MFSKKIMHTGVLEKNASGRTRGKRISQLSSRAPRENAGDFLQG